MKNKWNLLLGTALACGFLTLGVVSCGNQNAEFICPDEPDICPDTNYEEGENSVKKARNAEAGTKVTVTGIVANIVYGQGHKENGFYLADNSGTINVYSPTIATQVQVGNLLTINATRSNYISSKETENAKKFGYTGSIQLTDAEIVENNTEKHNIDKCWYPRNTIKNILETPTSTNITTDTFRVKGFIHKSENPGFVNYFIDDLDDKTGSYVYSSSNGADFEWLAPYDNKLCEILLSPINAKCTASSMNYRFMPIAVEESSYVMSDCKYSEFVLEYYAKDQFIKEYNSNPELELITSIENKKLSHGPAKLTYTSDNENVAKIVASGEKAILNTVNDGTANITIKSEYKNTQATITVPINVKNIKVEGSVNVAEAISTADSEKVIVKGVVVSSLVNKDGFYIGDDTGVIAVTLSDASELANIELGNLIYVEGTRTHFKKPENTVGIGQSVIIDSKVLLNTFGEHEYSTKSFKESTISELVNIPVSEDASTQVYTVKAKINVKETQYYTAININDPADETKSISLYCSSSKQYGWLTDFKDEPEVTLELALCNWNDKKVYKCCVLSASAGTKKIVNNLNFAK